MTRRMVLRNVWIMFFAMVLIAALSHAQSKLPILKSLFKFLLAMALVVVQTKLHAYCELMSKELGRKFLVINLPGAALLIARHGLMEADPDGYTLLCIPSIPMPTMGYVKYTYADMQPIGTLDMAMPSLDCKEGF